jgi:hypothetical protein
MAWDAYSTHADVWVLGLPCDNKCANDGDGCAGDKVGKNPRRCCQAGSRCVQKSETFAKCVAAGMKIDEDFVGKVITCGACPSTIQCFQGTSRKP